MVTRASRAVFFNMNTKLERAEKSETDMKARKGGSALVSIGTPALRNLARTERSKS